MLNSRNLYRSLRCAVANLSILVSFCFAAEGQTPSVTLPQSSNPDSEARDELNQGVAAYKNASYAEAIGHFQKATELDPGSITAKKYLATALAQNVVPGLDTPDNLRIAEQSIAVFHQVLATEPHDVNSLKQIAGIYFSIKNLDNAKEWQKKVLDEAPTDPEAAYTVGVIDWNLAYRNVLKALLSVGLSDDGEGNTNAPPEVLQNIAAQNRPLVEEALHYLSQAVANRPKFADAMAYLNLVYRRKADVDWSDEAARADDLAKAKDWARKSMFMRQANEEKRTSAPNSTQP